MRHVMMRFASSYAIVKSVTLTLRNLPTEVEKAILEISRSEGISLNRAALRLLEAAPRKPARNSDFEEFFGT